MSVAIGVAAQRAVQIDKYPESHTNSDVTMLAIKVPKKAKSMIDPMYR